MIIKLNAGNTINGIPRRIYVLIVNGGISKVWKDISGFSSVPSEFSHLITGVEILTTTKEYKHLIKNYCN